MKKFSKILSVALLVALVLSLGVANAFAAGTNSISVSGAKNGENYNIYRLLDLSVGTNAQNEINSYRYTFNDTWKDFWTDGAGAAYIDVKGTGDDTFVQWKSDKSGASDMEAFAKAAAAYATANSIAPNANEVTAANNKAEWTNLENGYYLVTSTYGNAASVASTPANPVQQISEKNTDNTSDKEVQEAAERNGTAATWPAERANDAAIGDTIQFRSKVTIVKNTTGLVYHDTMTEGLTWSGSSSTKVYSNDTLTTEIDAANYTVAAGTNGETFTVTFTEEYLASLQAETTNVWVGYTAVLNDKAKVDTEEKNTGKITWGNAGEGKPTTTKTETHKFQILKYDGADSAHNPLAGAKFQLFTVATEGTALKLAKNEAGTIYRVVDALDTTALPDGFTMTEDDKIVTLASGNITVEGVDSDDYYLAETDAPTGFNAIEGRIKVVVSADNALIQEVENNNGTTLPSTGGIGTTIFYVIGGVLVLAAIILLVTKKRMSE